MTTRGVNPSLNLALATRETNHPTYSRMRGVKTDTIFGLFLKILRKRRFYTENGVRKEFSS
jgi:hypothetical protein